MTEDREGIALRYYFLSSLREERGYPILATTGLSGNTEQDPSVGGGESRGEKYLLLLRVKRVKTERSYRLHERQRLSETAVIYLSHNPVEQGD
jgi:hypothetical protein